MQLSDSTCRSQNNYSPGKMKIWPEIAALKWNIPKERNQNLLFRNLFIITSVTKIGLGGHLGTPRPTGFRYFAPVRWLTN